MQSEVNTRLLLTYRIQSKHVYKGRHLKFKFSPRLLVNVNIYEDQRNVFMKHLRAST